MFKNFVKSSLTALTLACIAVSAQAPTDLRIALVIGNAAYAGNAALANPTNDAKAMAETLRGLGFTVVEIRDGGRAQMLEAIAKVQATLKGKQAVGMLYYAGHGLQLDWRNYMVPVDAKLTSAADVAGQTVDVNAVIDAFKGAGNRMNILVLDACRDNPFRGSTAAGKGLAQVDAPPGTFLAYATAPGNVAEDGDVKTGNGLYTQYLLQELKKPTAKIEDVFKRVRLNVRKQSEGRQIPWESTSLEDDFFFNDGKVVAVAKQSESAKESAFNAEKADWDKIKDSKVAGDFYAFLLKFPNGLISEVAQAQLERLQQAKTIAVANKEGVTQVAASSRFRLGDTQESVMRDGYSGQEVQRLKTRVINVTADRVEMDSGSVFTPEGGTIKNRFIADMSPPRLDLPAGDYVVGKKWAYRSIQTSPQGTKFWTEGEVKIVALEDVTVPAGTFKAYKLELNSLDQHGTRAKLVRWQQPEWGYSLKTLREIRPRSGNPTLEIYEMVSRERSKG
jgi:Caspase domain